MNRQLHRPLMWLSYAMVASAIFCVLGLIFDHRVLGGAPIWLKPFKFSVSTGIYALTAAWMYSLLSRARRTGWQAGTAISVLLGVEMVVLVGQAARGAQSHFNVSTPLNVGLYAVMAVAIVGVWVVSMGFAVLLCQERLTADAPARWAVRLGLLISLLGMAVAVPMTIPSSRQIATVGSTGIIGAHSVGVADGGPGLLITGWSTIGGDLRVPHFFGLHALQAVPLLAMALLSLASRIPRLRDEQTRLRLVWIGAGTYAALVVLLTWQALRGQSFARPDIVTLVTASVLLVAALLCATGVLWPGNAVNAGEPHSRHRY